MLTRYPLRVFRASASAEALLKRPFETSLPGVEVKIDSAFLSHVQTALLFPDESPCEVELLLIRNSSENSENWGQVLDGNQTLSLTRFIGEGLHGLEFDKSIDLKEEEEEKRNVRLGRAFIEGVECWLFIEHKRKNVEGVIRMQIHLHANRITSQYWDNEMHLSVVVLRKK